MTRYRHTLLIILMKTSWREKVNLPPQSSSLCILYKISLWIDYINVIHISLHGWRLMEAVWGSEVPERAAALLQKGRDNSPHHDALNTLLFLLPLFWGRDHLIPMILQCMVGWFSYSPREIWNIQPCLRSFLYQLWVEKTRNKQDQLPIWIWCWHTLLSQGEHPNNGWLNPKYRSKAILDSERHTQVGTATTWERVLKPGMGLSFLNASTVVPTLSAQLAPQLWSAFIQHFTRNISSSVQNQQKIAAKTLIPVGCWIE